MANYRSYVICTSPRSGSTLLCNLLASTGVAGNPESYFHTASLDDWWIDLGLVSQRPTVETETLRQVFKIAREQGTAGTSIFGLRLQRHSFAFFVEKAGLLFPGHRCDRLRFEAAFGKTLFIHLSRLDKVDQAISYVKATQTGLWHRAADGSELERLSPPEEPVYDSQAIELARDELTAQDNEWEDWFRQEKITPLRVTYDQLSENPLGVLTGILVSLGIDPAVANGVTPGVAKLADSTNRGWKRDFIVETTK